jgi:hypothetical protein
VLLQLAKLLIACLTSVGCTTASPFDAIMKAPLHTEMRLSLVEQENEKGSKSQSVRLLSTSIYLETEQRV